MTNKTNTKLTFNCTCSGCRGYFSRPAEIWHESQIAGKTNGYYFSRDTMKFWRSRVVEFKPIENPNGEIPGLAVIVSSKYPDAAARQYEVLTICQYGEVNRDYAFGNIGMVYYETLKAAKKAFESVAYPGECSCHGCQLDRAGVSIKDRRGF